MSQTYIDIQDLIYSLAAIPCAAAFIYFAMRLWPEELQRWKGRRK